MRSFAALSTDPRSMERRSDKMRNPTRQPPFSTYWDRVNEALRAAGEPTAKRDEAGMLYETGQPAEDAASVIIDQRRHHAAEEDRADQVYWEGH
jgi:hypothetical protein